MAESEKQQLDLNIGNWTIEDLYELFEIPKNASTNQVASLADKVIQRQTEGDIKYFLQLGRNKIINYQQEKLEGLQYEERTDRQLRTWWDNQYLTSGDEVQANKATIRTNKVEIFDDKSGHYQMKQNRLGVNSTHNVPFLQGTMNPTLVNQVERTLIIDSQYRTNIYPYSGGTGQTIASLDDPSVDKPTIGNPSSPSFNTDFTLTLSENLTNVLELKLDSVSIPKTWANFSAFIGNSRFGIHDMSSNKTFIINIPESSPASPQELVDLINGQIAYNFALPEYIYDSDDPLDPFPIQEVPNQFNYIAQDIKFYYDSTINTILVNANSEDISGQTSYLGTGNEYKLIWFDKELFSKPDDESLYGENCFNVEFTNNNLGWYMGFRDTPDPITNIVSSTYKTVIGGQSKLPADTSPKIKAIDYLVVVVDDFNKNRLNTGIISGIQQGTKLPIPNYINADNLNCNEDGDKAFFSKVAPRKLTQAQLYTINTIIEDRQKSKNRNTAPTLSDAFCTIPVPTNIEQDDRLVLYSNQISTSIRKYFGPVNIERIRARLFDDKGNIVNLKGHDWSFTLKVKQLYQY